MGESGLKIKLFLNNFYMIISFEDFSSKYGGLESVELIKSAVAEFDNKKIALLCAFNPEDVIICKWLSEFAPDVPVLFLDTKKHFPDTLRYVKQIVESLKLQDVRILEPDIQLIENSDPEGVIWQSQVNRCCWLRKVEPIEKEINKSDFDVLITGRRKEQTPERDDIMAIEQDENLRIKINPLFNWNKQKREQSMQELQLPHHPLYDLGYLSIGCAPCTTPIFKGEDERAGRWRHTRISNDSQAAQSGKTECGLHVETNIEESN